MDKSITLDAVALSKKDRQTQVSQQIYDYHNIAYFCVDQHWVVLDVSENLKDFGFSDVIVGVVATDVVDFLVGADTSIEAELSPLTSPSKVPIRVLLLPSQDHMAEPGHGIPQQTGSLRTIRPAWPMSAPYPNLALQRGLGGHV